GSRTRMPRGRERAGRRGSAGAAGSCRRSWDEVSECARGANHMEWCLAARDRLPRSRTRSRRRQMPVNEASSEETPYGRYVTSDGWFVLNLTEALAVRNDEKGGALYPLEARAAPFGDFGVNVRVLEPGQPNAMYHAESDQE